MLAIECLPQSRETAFGVVHTITTPGALSHLRKIPGLDRSSIRLLLWNTAPPEVYVARVDSTFLRMSTVHHSVPFAFDDILGADVNRDSRTDLLFLSKANQAISVVLDLSRNTLSAPRTILLPFVPSGWSLGDIDNNGKLDILVYDRNNPGIVPLMGDGKGGFVVGKTIAPDLPVGCLSVTHLNNDNLLDIVAYDWVKSELHLLYGVGRGRFLDQSVFPVNGEVFEILPAAIDPESVLDFLLIMRQPAEIQMWQGNGIGEFRLSKRASLGAFPVSYALGDVNNDGSQDVSILDSKSSLQVSINNGEEWLNEWIPFAAGTDPRQLIVTDLNGDGRMDAIVLDSIGQSLRFLFSSLQENVLEDSLEFATGIHPSGLVIRNAVRNAQNDLVAVNTKSRSLSVYAGRRSNTLMGQVSYALSIDPLFLTFHSSTDSSVRYIVNSRSPDSLVFFTLNVRDSSSSYAVIPSEGLSEVIQAGVTSGQESEFFTFNTIAGVDTPAIHYYQRLNPGTFIEQSFRLGKPNLLLGATACFMNDDRYPDLIYVYRNLDSANIDLVVSYGDSLQSYTQRNSSIDLSSIPMGRAYLWTSSFAHAAALDLLIYASEPGNTLYVAKGRGGGQFDGPVPVLRDVRLLNRSMLQIVDADNDGSLDIVLANAATRKLGWMRGRLDGSFEQWKPLVGMEEEQMFTIGDLNGDGIGDIALTMKARGIVKILNGAARFVKGRSRNEK